MRHLVQDREAAGAAARTIDAVRERAAELGDRIAAPDILLALAVLGATYGLSLIIGLAAGVLARRLPGRRHTVLQAIPLVRIPLWLGCIYLITVGIFDPPREWLIALAAAAGIGTGFAAQDVLKNVLGGILIVIDRPFRVGDVVDIGHYHGEVVGIGLRATRIRTRDDSIVIVPNSHVVAREVSNASAGERHCAVTVDLFLPAHIDTTRAGQICYEAAASSPYLYGRKPITVHFQDELREAHVIRAHIRAYVYDHRHESAFASDVVERAKRALLDSGLLFGSGLIGQGTRADLRTLDAAAT